MPSYYTQELLEAEKQCLLKITVFVIAGDEDTESVMAEENKNRLSDQREGTTQKMHRKNERKIQRENLRRNTTKRKICATYFISSNMLTGD